ncbi:uncharacterized protein LACBIDRAFT_333083 [Laccaria bicolor S238N-H82]|uniref:Predicted protein n=1 Tax=Laccaria bicolor (strain S238N-H82 / ATCC MYA-4686) TaxID=486041 RepID=B0DUT5_LACBS|nr:uncharacterized protein LACBIDRAFT_333083 [Laccaria bicolor S238N-H82]EDR01667.1 predicted protein [Laccaria bicolor S238N-H82]|eukprot:XP_001887743.1 predicted protein [Laccaria bicolor S238N-H82]
MLELYDSSPWSQEVQENRLKYARALSNANIECLIWGEDALAFAHFVPTCFDALQLLVADQDLHAASTQIKKSLECRLFSGFNPHHVEKIVFNPSQPKAFPHSVCLETTIAACNRTPDDPDFIFIHPQSQFYFNIQDKSRSLSLAPFPDNIRFPTLTAFLDSMIATYLDPPSGRNHSRVQDPLKVWISYLLTYTLPLRKRPSVLPNGDLQPEHEEVLRSLKPENRPFFDSFVRSNIIPVREHQIRRKEILEKLGVAIYHYEIQSAPAVTTINNLSQHVYLGTGHHFTQDLFLNIFEKRDEAMQKEYEAEEMSQAWNRMNGKARRFLLDG